MDAARRSAWRWRRSATTCCAPPPRGSTWPRSTFPLVDKQGCVTVKTNAYSVPARAGSRVEARVHPLQVELWHGGRRIAAPRALPRPPPAGAGPRALPRRAGPQARRAGRVQAAGAMAPGRALARLPRRALGSAAGPARQAGRHPRHGGGAAAGPGVRRRTGCGRRSPRRCRSAPATSRRCAIC